MESTIQIQLFKIYFQSKFCTSIFILLKHKLRREKHGWKLEGPAGVAESQIQQIFPGGL